MMKLLSVKRDNCDRVSATYELSHSTPGRNGTTLNMQMVCTLDPAGGDCRAPGVFASISIEGPREATAPEAFDKLAEWLERCAIAIRSRKLNALDLPTFVSVPGDPRQ